MSLRWLALVVMAVFFSGVLDFCWF